MKSNAYTLISSHTFDDGTEWEIRFDKALGRGRERYCAHIKCAFKHNKNEYPGLWSWEMDDGIESDNGLPWCWFCHVAVPEGLLVIMTMLRN